MNTVIELRHSATDRLTSGGGSSVEPQGHVARPLRRCEHDGHPHPGVDVSVQQEEQAWDWLDDMLQDSTSWASLLPPLVAGAALERFSRRRIPVLRFYEALADSDDSEISLVARSRWFVAKQDQIDALGHDRRVANIGLIYQTQRTLANARSSGAIPVTAFSRQRGRDAFLRFLDIEEEEPLDASRSIEN